MASRATLIRCAPSAVVHVQKAGKLENRLAILRQILEVADDELRARYRERLTMGWVYHDSALEGTVYSMPELQAAIYEQVVSDAALIPVYDEIRQHKSAIDIVRDLAEKRGTISLEVIKKIYVTLDPEGADGKGPPKYRKDMPIHRLYFHEIAQPDKIQPRMKTLIDWINAPDTKRSTHVVRLASKAHHEMLQIYPFKKHSGKVARLLMNLILLRNEYPEAIIHSTERQRYYDALKTSPDAVARVVTEALSASIESAIHFFETGGGTSGVRPA